MGCRQSQINEEDNFDVLDRGVKPAPISHTPRTARSTPHFAVLNTFAFPNVLILKIFNKICLNNKLLQKTYFQGSTKTPRNDNDNNAANPEAGSSPSQQYDFWPTGCVSSILKSSTNISNSKWKQISLSKSWSEAYTKLTKNEDGTTHALLTRLDELPLRPWQAIWETLLLEVATSSGHIHPGVLAQALRNNVVFHSKEGEKNVIAAEEWRVMAHCVLPMSSTASEKQHQNYNIKNNVFKKAGAGAGAGAAAAAENSSNPPIRRFLRAMKGILRIQEELFSLAKLFAIGISDEKYRKYIFQIVMVDMISVLRTYSQSLQENTTTKSNKNQETNKQNQDIYYRSIKEPLDYFMSNESGVTEQDKLLHVAQTTGLHWRGNSNYFFFVCF